MSILNILNELSATRSKLEKVAILEKNKDNDVLRSVFLATYDPMLSYYMIKTPEFTPGLASCGWNDVFEVLTKLSSREVTGYDAKNALGSVLATVDADTAEVVSRILKRDLRVGCSSSTANKVWKDLIQKYPCMLCESFSEKNLARITFPALAQEKCDGMRVNFVIKNGAVEVFSRAGKPIDLKGALDVSILQVMGAMEETEGMIDGELLVVDEAGRIMTRAEGNGILNKAIKGTITEELAKRVVTKVWDFISADEFSNVKNAKGTTSLSRRWAKILMAVDRRGGADIFTPQTRTVNSLDEAKAFYAEQLALGREGAVLKSCDGVWENRRSRTQVKLKVENDVELLVVGKNEGTGRLANNLGSLRCVSEDGGLEVNVSGFSDAQREYYWMSQDIVGSIITVKANDYQKSDGKDTLSLFLPVYVENRLDKSKANTTEEIMSSFDGIYGRGEK